MHDHIASALTLLSHGWAAFSIVATLAGLGGVGLIAVALLAAAYLPAVLRHALVAAGLVLLIGAALYQAGQARGAHEAFALQAKTDLQRARDALAEVDRQVAAATAISAGDRARAEAAEASAKAAASRLRDLKAHLARTPDAGCVTGDDARRLRGL
ncbi:hypothetical protein SAMN05216360_10390 [Methylobacterium phyllostachyos]|uniref:Uncharacterized protein n=1 Tax=Methylobacterium phyllostachyos TaxID=582672 RepID=A0A1G9V782_9HYPH|nr:hypothetical protein [Methylobacterium phyllostachyos]SDM67917.1 hypothetical protein SAMN05216360_10390 [Methylobacterium phyllostachyos]